MQVVNDSGEDVTYSTPNGGCEKLMDGHAREIPSEEPGEVCFYKNKEKCDDLIECSGIIQIKDVAVLRPEATSPRIKVFTGQ